MSACQIPESVMRQEGQAVAPDEPDASTAESNAERNWPREGIDAMPGVALGSRQDGR